MAGIFRQKRDELCSHGLGDKLAALCNALLLKALASVGVDDTIVKRECIEQKELKEHEAFDDKKASTAPLSTLDFQRSRRRRADEAPESPLPTDTAAFD